MSTVPQWVNDDPYVHHVHTDSAGDNLWVCLSESGRWPPALHVGTPGRTRAVLLPEDPAELDALLARIRGIALGGPS